jgi:hypothetical protein
LGENFPAEANAPNNRRVVFSVLSAAFISTQRCGKEISAAVNPQAATEEAVFSVGVAQNLYKEVRRQLALEMRESLELAFGRIIEKKWQERN